MPKISPEKRPVLRILGAGLCDLDALHASNIIGREYGVIYEIVGGCTESQEFMDSLDKLNSLVSAQLEKEFGADWEKTLESKADSMEFLISQAESLLERQEEYKKKNKELESKGIYVSLWIEPTASADIFNAVLYKTIRLLPAVSNNKIYYSWNIDLDKRKILSDFQSLINPLLPKTNSSSDHSESYAPAYPSW
ncbi:MAG: hypothetical protein QM791_08735 [Ferruginibacter sp.]